MSVACPLIMLKLFYLLFPQSISIDYRRILDRARKNIVLTVWHLFLNSCLLFGFPSFAICMELVFQSD